MFTKALSALAILLSTVCGAVAVTKHEGTAANRAPANKASPQNPRDKADFVVGNMLFVGFHEMGHALTDQFHLPTLGRAEDAADSFATIALLNAGSELSINVLVQAARVPDHLCDGWLRPGAVQGTGRPGPHGAGSSAHVRQRLRGCEIRLAFAARIAPARRRRADRDHRDRLRSRPGQSEALCEVVPVRRAFGSSIGLRVEPLRLAASDQDCHGELWRRQCGVGFLSQPRNPVLRT